MGPWADPAGLSLGSYAEAETDQPVQSKGFPTRPDVPLESPSHPLAGASQLPVLPRHTQLLVLPAAASMDTGGPYVQYFKRSLILQGSF